MSELQRGNHTDLYGIEARIDGMAVQLKNAGLNPDGPFTHADAGFDAKSFRQVLEKYGIIADVCPNPRNGESSQDNLFDPEMYKERWIIERINAWLDGFRSILNRFDTTVTSWKGWNYLAFAGVFLKKIHKLKKFR